MIRIVCDKSEHRRMKNMISIGFTEQRKCFEFYAKYFYTSFYKCYVWDFEKKE